MGELTDQIARWFSEQIPMGWFESTQVDADEHEILVVGKLGGPTASDGAKDVTEAIRRFRESTRQDRIEIASRAEQLFNRKVSWGVELDGTTKMFTGLGVPVMTRLRLRERALLDTLVSTGVARSRSEALAWCATLVASKQKEWIEDLKQAMRQVEEVRERGPVTSS